ncbi:2-oxoglutarate dehydrogenase, E2 component, dihydrolipoamide succinyltransferase [Mycolicibacterium neoaurum]|uniref:2-oxoglutarate dehydrogenase, E2 component, dihydrolipoamide succinyltransferase n=1 Tax=Mycolicibacterium neoaurum TaxID=1795 RepID=UPI00248BD3D3|nr:2-oxoglutarate dehydrogenase, E2 component, dihydrolipoamide succinyltransferase [Mycolicibacterium neoaurum]WBP93839.1 2-oxoglutarate dehydrogenase, E2 component, dihydrolipoamide succinyltransferase [Mycolicibacterium neoaurum]WBS07632.1 2-oxoglutarate dehydrogenase, E2 component, dihydrolipoamide succinyltransferase [Mycolicibacterium neoaurum]
MAISVQMPALGESVTEGTVTRWLKQEGDTVAVDEPLLEVSTDKVDTEIPSPAAGVLTKIIAAEDDVVEVGGDLALIGEEGESAPTGDSTPAEEAEPEAEPEPAAAEEAEPEPEAEESAPEQAKPAKPAASGGGDATSVKMPELGESVTEGTVTRWLKKVGDEVAVDEALVEVSTDKVDTEIPSPVAGTLLSISAEEDDVVAVGGELAKIGDAGAEGAAAEPEPKEEPKQEATPEPKAEPKQEATPEPKAEPKQQATPEPKPEPKAEPAPAAAGSETDANPYVTPLVRKLAAENNVDLSSVKGTGVGGRIRKQDVLAAAEAAKAPAAGQEKEAAPSVGQKKEAAPAPSLAHLRGSTQKANRIRQITAKKTRESLQTTAQLTQVHEVDLTKIVALRAKAKKSFSEREGVNLTFLPFFAVAVVDALKAHPNINASYNEDTKEITYYDAEHLGFAVDTEQGLLSPVVHNAGDLSLGGLARAIADIATRARSGNLKPDELSGGTFTITNIGSQGALFDTPILVPPQAAMLGTGAIVKRPRVISDEFGNESIGVRSVAYLPLTYDHRLIDGADAGRFLTTVKRRLEEGAFEADLGL